MVQLMAEPKVRNYHNTTSGYGLNVPPGYKPGAPMPTGSNAMSMPTGHMMMAQPNMGMMPGSAPMGMPQASYGMVTIYNWIYSYLFTYNSLFLFFNCFMYIKPSNYPSAGMYPNMLQTTPGQQQPQPSYQSAVLPQQQQFASNVTSAVPGYPGGYPMMANQQMQQQQQGYQTNMPYNKYTNTGMKK